MLDTAPLLCYNSLVILERPTGGESHMCQKKKAFVENRDQYRGVFSFCSIGVLLAALTGCFAFIWYRFYSDAILSAWQLGHDFVICRPSIVIWEGIWWAESGLFKAKRFVL